MGEERACNDDDRDFNIADGVFDSTVQLNVTGGTRYFVFVDGSREQAGDFTLRVIDGPCVSAQPMVDEPDDVNEEVGGLCANPPELRAGVVKQGDTRQGVSEHRAACGSGFGKEQVYHYRSFIDRTVCVRTVGC